MFQKYLLSDESIDYEINVNAVELTSDGKKETVVDYIDFVKTTDRYSDNSAFRTQVNDIEEILVEDFNAKSFGEL